MEIVRFECGCIGSKPNDENKSYIFEACDSNNWDHGPQPGAKDRIMSGKHYKPVSQGYAEYLWDIFNQAYQCRVFEAALKGLMRIK